VRTPGGNHPAEHLTDQNFNAKVLGAKGPVLVDFTRPGCPPCATISPAIDRLAQQYAGRASVYKVDVSKFPELAAQYRVSGTPTMVVFNHGKPVDSVSGAVNPSVLAGMLDRQMPRTASNPERVPPVAPSAPERVRPPHSNAPGHPERVRPPVPTDTDDSNQPHHGERFEKFKRFIDKLKPFSRHEKEAAMTLTPYEEQSLAILKQARQRAGKQPLEFDPRLKLAALKKAEYANGRLSARDNLHYSGPPGFNSPQAAFAQVGFNDYRECADTLSGGTYERHFPPKGLINDWMRSPAHRRILMSNADVAGIAVVGDKAYICISNHDRFREEL
jgi:thioredoxin 1